jgi:Fungal potassium channel
LYSVMELDLIPTGSNAAPAGTSPVAQFFINIKALAESNYHQAVVLFGMLFTLVIWVIAALSLILSVILYLIFLWHHIPTMDGSLKRYCRRKINTRLERIVRKKTATALAKGGLQLQGRAPTMPLADGEELKPVKVAPTLPSVAEYSEDKKPIVTVNALSRQPTQSTLPPYTSEPETYEEESYRKPMLPDLEDDGAWLTQTNTQNSAYGESASLTGGAAPMGYSSLDNHYGQPTLPPVPPVANQGRPYSPSMNRPPIGPGRAGPTGPIPMEGLGRRPYGPGYGPGYSQTPPPQMMGRQTPGFSRGGPPERSYSPAARMPYDRSYTPANNPPFDRQQTPQSNMHNMRSNSPANNLPPGRSLTSPGPNFMPSVSDPVHRTNTPGDRVASPRPPNQGGYVAFNPFASSMDTNTDANARSQSPVSSNPELVIRPPTVDHSPDSSFHSHHESTSSNSSQPIIRHPTTEQAHNSNFQAYRPMATGSQPIIRPATTEPPHTPTFDSYLPIVRAATTTPSNGFGRHELHSQQQPHTTLEEEDDDEYDPLSYYGSSA